MITLVPMTRHVIGSGFFCEAGVKKFAADFSVGHFLVVASMLVGSKDSLVTVESTLRRSGGGEMPWGEATRLTAPSAILTVRASEDVVKVYG